MEYIPFTYVIRWSSLNLSYYGCRYAKRKTSKGGLANPSTLWTTYFTSSIIVKNLILEHGDPDIIQVRRTFKTGEEAKLWETKVLKRLNVLSKDIWINRGYCDFGSQVTSTWSPERREKFMRYWTPATRQKKSIETTLNNLNQTEATRKKRSEALKGRVFSDLTKAKMSESKKGRIITTEWRNNISKTTKGRPHSKDHTQKAVEGRIKNRKYKWVIITPDGSKIIVDNLKEFCRDASICNTNVVARSKDGKTHKGYQAFKIPNE